MARTTLSTYLKSPRIITFSKSTTNYLIENLIFFYKITALTSFDNLVYFSWHTEPTRAILIENRCKQNQGLLSDLKQAQDWHETDRKLSKTTLYFCIATEKRINIFTCSIWMFKGQPCDIYMYESITSLKTLLASQRFDQYWCIYTCIFSHFCFKNFQYHPKQPLSR